MGTGRVRKWAEAAMLCVCCEVVCAVPAGAAEISPSTLNTAIVSLAIGVLAAAVTSLTWVGTQIIATRHRAHDRREAARQEQRKQLAFFAILQSELDHMMDRLRSSKRTLDASRASVESTGVGGRSSASWLSYVRIASNIGDFRSFEHDWDKLYIIGAENIRRLRDFDLALSELNTSFKRTLALYDNGRMPLFEREDEVERICLIIETLTDHIDGVLESGRKLEVIATAVVEGTAHGLGATTRLPTTRRRLESSEEDPPSAVVGATRHH